MSLLQMSIGATLFLYALAILLAMRRLVRGPRAQDRVLALDFIFVAAMLVVLVLGILHESAMYFEAALLMALFGFVSSGVTCDTCLICERRRLISVPFG